MAHETAAGRQASGGSLLAAPPPPQLLRRFFVAAAGVFLCKFIPARRLYYVIGNLLIAQFLNACVGCLSLDQDETM